MYEGGDAAWYKKVVDKQKELMQKSGLDDKHRNAIIARLDAMLDKKCTVCECVGHINSYCWFNSQLFSECRGSAEGVEAWTCYRQGIKLTKAFSKLEMMLKIKKNVALKANPMLVKGALMNSGFIDPDVVMQEV